MKAVDTNILVHAHRGESPFNKTSLAVIDELIESDATWYIPWPCLFEFYSVVTNPRVFKKGDASTAEQALKQIDAWLQAPNVELLSENEHTLNIVKRLAKTGRLSGPIIHDARIYAICESAHVDALLTFDRDFSRMMGSLHIEIVG